MTQTGLVDADGGALAVIDENNMPYGAPMSFALSNHSIYFHCSAAGGKKMKHCTGASFTVIAHTQLLPQQFATLCSASLTGKSI